MESKKVKLSFDWWEAILEINYNDNTLQWMKDQLLFWMGGQEMIDDADGDIEKAYLKMLAKKMIKLSMDWNSHGINSELDESEGWCALDEKFGVKLISVDEWNFEGDNFEIETH